MCADRDYAVELCHVRVLFAEANTHSLLISLWDDRLNSVVDKKAFRQGRALYDALASNAKNVATIPYESTRYNNPFILRPNVSYQK